MGRIIQGGDMATMVSWQIWSILITTTPQSCLDFPHLIQLQNCPSRAWRPSRTSGRRIRTVIMPKSPSLTIWLGPGPALEFLSRSFHSPMVWLADSLWVVLCTWKSVRYTTQSAFQVSHSTATPTKLWMWLHLMSSSSTSMRLMLRLGRPPPYLPHPCQLTQARWHLPTVCSHKSLKLSLLPTTAPPHCPETAWHVAWMYHQRCLLSTSPHWRGFRVMPPSATLSCQPEELFAESQALAVARTTLRFLPGSTPLVAVMHVTHSYPMATWRASTATASSPSSSAELWSVAQPHWNLMSLPNHSLSLPPHL